MFNGWKRKVIPQAEDTPQENVDKRNRLAAAGLAATVAAGAAYIAEKPQDVDLHQNTQPTQEHKVTVADMHKLQEEGPMGMTVKADPENGRPVINMPASANSPEITNIDYGKDPRYQPKTMEPPE